ncbi:MAG: hypothetical protein WD042_09240 [Phycisphaeraceae bacterium]
MKIIVLGYLVRGPLGGMAWHHLQYVVGLARLGHEVYFIEDSGDEPACYDPTRWVTDADPSFGLRFARQAFDRLGLGDRWGYWDQHTTRWLGPLGDRARGLCESAAVVLNVSGINPLRPWLMQAPRRVLIDTDPAFTQIRHLTEPSAMALAKQHNAFFTFGENFGKRGCSIPDDGLWWYPTRQPVVLDLWPVTPAPAPPPPPPEEPITTVMQWQSYPPREWEGVQYGQKSLSFAPYMTLPQRSGATFELAIGGGAPADELRAHGWRIVDVLEATRDPWRYQQFIQHSRAEWGVAKHGYVASHSGWFSERTLAYLASGRPAIVHDTGWTDFLPTCPGVLPFSDPDQAAAAVAALDDGYAQRCHAARDWVAAHFAAEQVLPPLLEIRDLADSALDDLGYARA